jgi:hypothetical protein
MPGGQLYSSVKIGTVASNKAKRIVNWPMDIADGRDIVFLKTMLKNKLIN